MAVVVAQQTADGSVACSGGTWLGPAGRSGRRPDCSDGHDPLRGRVLFRPPTIANHARKFKRLIASHESAEVGRYELSRLRPSISVSPRGSARWSFRSSPSPARRLRQRPPEAETALIPASLLVIPPQYQGVGTPVSGRQSSAVSRHIALQTEDSAKPYGSGGFPARSVSRTVARSPRGNCGRAVSRGSGRAEAPPHGRHRRCVRGGVRDLRRRVDLGDPVQVTPTATLTRPTK